MHVTLVHIHVTPENTGDFIAASRANPMTDEEITVVLEQRCAAGT